MDPGGGTESELSRVNQALKTLSAGNRTLLRASQEQDLLLGMCRVIVNEGGYRLAYVAYAQHDEQKSLPIMAYAIQRDIPEERDFFDHLQLTWADVELGQHAPAIAVRSGEPCIGRSLLTDPGHAPWREVAIRLDYSSLSAFPLPIDGEVVGALLIADSSPDAFDEAEVRLLGELADDLAYGIANLRSRIKRHEAEERIARMALYDSLTGLPNRTMFRSRLQSAIVDGRQKHRPLAVLLLSAMHFHEISDTLGYQQADLLTCSFARQLEDHQREDRFVACVGDAEFALLYPDMDVSQAMRTAQDLIRAFSSPVEVGGLSISVGLCAGIAAFPGHGTDPDSLIRRARMAMFEAKRRGSDSAVFTPELEQQRTNRLALMIDLRRAIEQKALMLYCQPKIDLATRRIRGAEGLVRWQHPAHGMIPAEEFVKIAETSGLITPLTYHVLEAAFQQIYAWHDMGIDQPLSVNLSARDLRDPALIDKLKNLFSTWGTRPDWIQFELTESALMEDPVGALDAIRRIKALGVELFIDDFGIGYSSLSYLHKLPVDAIKIDQSFVMAMPDSAISAAIVQSTIELGHRLDLEVVAEGVETESAWNHLVALGCDTAQGFYMARPMPAEQFRNWQVHYESSLH
ncbi:putative bifunctional diguanylate cyclase/phosphodiesterase [Aromatoleum petrolei]|uniref:EAL domain-containing protein n=1 Tax=Aromatoleum petrolei TaxID=76116 RepID=A0ABX1MLA3_9RHOO|nr:GGDEF domain-containing protein [Aromatoleum petrolei]NMF87150.1 EAL domain-containing protein [Aromatoleum petrolei]QTQ34887.1 Diguanylate cyclase/phosphodiesterase [Aromatoleum petrolei]